MYDCKRVFLPIVVVVVVIIIITVVGVAVQLKPVDLQSNSWNCEMHSICCYNPILFATGLSCHIY
jgi:hypothetical protein